MSIMRILKLFPFLLILQQLAACGQSSQNDAPTFKAPVLSNSSYRGMLVATMNVDPSFRTSTLFYYDFKEGLITKLIDEQIGNGRIFKTNRHAMFFHTNKNQSFFQTIQFSASSNLPQPSMPYLIEDLPANSPLAVASAPSNDTEYVFSYPDGNSLATLSLRSAEVSELSTANTAISDSVIVDFYEADQHIYALVSGVNQHFSPTGQQQVLKLSGDLKLVDPNEKTPVIDGYPLRATYPSKFVEINNTVYTVGFCREEIHNCESRVESFDPKTGSTQLVKSLNHPDIELVSSVLGIEREHSVALHIHDKVDAAYKLVEFDWEQDSFKEVYTFADESLFGSAYDHSTQTYFLGDRSGLGGQIVIKSSNQQDVVALQALPTHFVLVK